MISQRAVMTSVLALLALAPLARSADEPKVEGDLKALQGDWISKDEQGESTWTFKGDKLHLKTPDREYDITIKIDEKAKPEKTMDFAVAEDSPNAKGFKSPGIYKIDGKKASICFAAEGTTPPEKFVTDFGKSFNFDLTKKDK